MFDLFCKEITQNTSVDSFNSGNGIVAQDLKKEQKGVSEDDEAADLGVLLRRSSGSNAIMPLSTRFIRAAASLGCCPDCKGHSAKNSKKGVDIEAVERALQTSAPLGKYHFDQLRRQKSSISSLVLGPMIMSNHSNQDVTYVERILAEYRECCDFFKVEPNSGVLTCLRFSLPSLRVSPGFGDSDMLALVEVLLRYANGPLSHITRLDFSLSPERGFKRQLLGKPGLRSHGALALAKLLQATQHVQEVLLDRNRLGSFGASAVFLACVSNPVIHRLGMRRCRIGERGGLAFAELINKCRGLMDVDLSSNGIGFRGCLAMEQALKMRHEEHPELVPVTVNLEGNLVLQEIMNGVTHGLGIILALIGACLLSAQVQAKPIRHVISCAVYSSSLVVLYTSSTLYHSFFTLQQTKYIFEVLDKCAIYILIAGSYTPFLNIIMADSPLWSIGLSCFIWSCACIGISVEAMCPAYKNKLLFSLSMYLGMGWSALVCLPEVSRRVDDNLLHLIVLGGSAYTLGVPFFVRNHNLDHCIWHVFVLAGSAFHWLGIYMYVAPYGAESCIT